MAPLRREWHEARAAIESLLTTGAKVPHVAQPPAAVGSDVAQPPSAESSSSPPLAKPARGHYVRRALAARPGLIAELSTLRG